MSVPMLLNQRNTVFFGDTWLFFEGVAIVLCGCSSDSDDVYPYDVAVYFV